MEKITLVIIDDHPFFRQGVVDALSLEDDFQVIGQAEDGEEGARLIRVLTPCVAVVDVNLPGMNGLQVVRQVVGEKIGTRVVLLTAYDDVEQKIHAIQAGAFAYCTKDIQPEALSEVIRLVNSGKYVVSGGVYNSIQVKHWMEAQINSVLRPASDPETAYQPLSEREMEVLEHITRGLSNKEIAALLGISHQTVKNHITSILRKLSVEDRTQAALYALQRGWVRIH
jgi:DNA-binding NarL/FixJ family response regulator